MNKIDLLLQQVAELQGKILEIQAQCTHPEASLDSKHGADTGNYDPGADSYWTENKCGLCQKGWTVYSK